MLSNYKVMNGNTNTFMAKPDTIEYWGGGE